MITIYCIEDINDLRYVGQTRNKLSIRLSKHRSVKYNAKNCSSKKLHLEHCIIYPLEVCADFISIQRERYWINKLNSVNDKKLNGMDKDTINAKRREYYHNNKDLINSKLREERRLKKLKPLD
tara:strand:- start:4009 stop:4377 length:369 start_codon:yes stop_codon:yes gene_type:complete